MQTKGDLRNQIQKLLPNIVKQESKSQQIGKKVDKIIRSSQLTNILLYDKFLYEVDLSEYFESWMSRANIFLAHKRDFGFWEYNTSNFYSDFGKIDCVIAPGLAFDKRGYRLGRGGGWYDKLLENFKLELTIGVCFDEQLLEEIPVDSYDKKFDIVISDVRKILVEKE